MSTHLHGDAASRAAGPRRSPMPLSAMAIASITPRQRRSRCGRVPSRSRAAPRSTATGRSTRRRPPRASSPRPSTRRCMTSGCGICGRSATARCTALPNGRSCARSPRRSRSTRSPISTSIWTSSRPMRDRTAIHVHWARDAAEHNRIVHGILSDHGATSLIKSKSMLTEECGFRPYMASVGIEVIETDLGERIQQLDNEDPSHVVVPAVHKLRTDVAEVFSRTIGTDPGQQRCPLSGGSAARGDPPADPQRRCRDDRLQFRGRRDRHLRRLHQRGQCRSVGQCAEAAHRLDRHREDHPAPRASWRCSSACCRAARSARR